MHEASGNVAGGLAPASRPADLPTTAGGVMSSPAPSIAQRLSPALSALFGPATPSTARSEWFWDDAQVIITHVFGPTTLPPVEAAVLVQPDVERERAELPALVPLRPILADRSTPAPSCSSVDTVPVSVPVVPPARRFTPLRYAVITAGVYTSSVLVFGLSAPSISESLERFRRAVRVGRRRS
jgi:hypothetical protein